MRDLPRWDFDRAVQLAKRAIAEQGSEYRYGPIDCVYFAEGKPSCIVGHMLAYDGVTAEFVDANEFNDEGVHNLPLGADIKTEIFLIELQEQQDQEMPWGDALQLAIWKAEEVQ